MINHNNNNNNNYRIFNKAWALKLEAKRSHEFDHEKNARSKAQEDYSSWHTQRDIRLNAKKETNRSEVKHYIFNFLLFI